MSYEDCIKIWDVIYCPYLCIWVESVGESENSRIKSTEKRWKYWKVLRIAGKVLKVLWEAMILSITENVFEKHLINLKDMYIWTYSFTCKTMLVNSVCYFTDNVVDQIEHSLQLTSLYVHLALLQIQKDSTLDLYDRIVLFSMFLSFLNVFLRI